MKYTSYLGVYPCYHKFDKKAIDFDKKMKIKRTETRINKGFRPYDINQFKKIHILPAYRPAQHKSCTVRCRVRSVHRCRQI